MCHILSSVYNYPEVDKIWSRIWGMYACEEICVSVYVCHGSFKDHVLTAAFNTGYLHIWLLGAPEVLLVQTSRLRYAAQYPWRVHRAALAQGTGQLSVAQRIQDQIHSMSEVSVSSRHFEPVF